LRRGIAVLALGACAASCAARPVPAALRLREEARALAPLFRTELVAKFLHETAALPHVSPRILLHDPAASAVYTEAEARALPEERRHTLRSKTYGEEYYYLTRYGTPLAYARPLEILAEAGLRDVAGKRVLDFGYGGIGHLRLLAGLGAAATGIEVDPVARALYSFTGDQGEVQGKSAKGRLTLVHGRYPAEESVRAAVGGDYDVILSKNVLKNGYIHPAEPVPEGKRIRLGVSDEEFVRALLAAVRPGGRVLLYNLCPAPAPPGKPYMPWADGRSPFSRAMWEKAGFRVIAFDRDDTGNARALGRALGWDREGMDLDRDLFGTYTLVERP
jgi:SAM-dependent methyltransferase